MAAEQLTIGQLRTHAITVSIGIAFGAVWWFIGASAVPGAAPALYVVGGAVVVTSAVWLVRLRRAAAGFPRGNGDHSPFRHWYGGVVAAEIVAIVAGAVLLSKQFQRPEAISAWIQFVVGVHFLPFRWIFRSRRFLVSGILLCAVSGSAAVVAVLAHFPQAWQLIPGLGGAAVLWGSTLTDIRGTSTQIRRGATHSRRPPKSANPTS